MTDRPKPNFNDIRNISEDAGLPQNTLRIPMPSVKPPKPEAPKPAKR
ncbi:hypothetical protein [Endobacterium cereale]|nr:hypothetical protein [Endobacterium cereale]MEB2843790.1 hypothetical protein [Endobacterium cereale]